MLIYSVVFSAYACLKIVEYEHIRIALDKIPANVRLKQKKWTSVTNQIRGLPEAYLDDLCHHKNDNVALLAAWQRVARTIKPTEVSQKIDPLAMQRYLGFVEGRLRLKIPKWWYFEMSRAHSFNPRTILTYKLEGSKHFPFYSPRFPFVFPAILKGLKVVVDKKKPSLTLKFGKDEIRIPNKLVKLKKKIRDKTIDDYVYSGMIYKNKCYFVFGSYNESPFVTLWCLSMINSDVIWSRSNVGIPTKEYSIANFPETPWVTLHVYGNEVYAFGATGLTFFFESFDLNTGKRRIHFSTGD